MFNTLVSKAVWQQSRIKKKWWILFLLFQNSWINPMWKSGPDFQFPNKLHLETFFTSNLTPWLNHIVSEKDCIFVIYYGKVLLNLVIHLLIWYYSVFYARNIRCGILTFSINAITMENITQHCSQDGKWKVTAIQGCS